MAGMWRGLLAPAPAFLPVCSRGVSCVRSSYGAAAETTAQTVQQAARRATGLAADRRLCRPIPEHPFDLVTFN